MAHNIQISNWDVQKELAAEKATAAKMFNGQTRDEVFLGMTF